MKAPTKHERMTVGRKPRLLGAALVAALAVAAVAASAQATAPGKNGRIAYTHFGRHHDAAIKTVRANGSDVKTLTRPPKGVEDLDADWRPDGKKIVFQRRVSEDNSQLYTVNANGTGLTQITSYPNPGASDPAYSPDGTRIAAELRHGLYVLNADGSNPVLVRASDQKGEAGQPQWSPDGSRLVFGFVRYDIGRTGIFTIKPDGSDPKRITPWRLDLEHPDWSPNGRKIVLESYGHGAPGHKSENIYTVRRNGSHLKKLTHNKGGVPSSTNPGWSPNGKQIVFARNHEGPPRPPGSCCNTNIFKMKANGSHVREVSKSRLFEFDPDWGARP